MLHHTFDSSLPTTSIPVVVPGASTDSIARAEASLARLTELVELTQLLHTAEPYDVPPLGLELPPGFKLSIVIPVYNEERTIREILARVAALPVPKEIVVVDDCSRDRTAQTLRELQHCGDVKVIYKPHNEGKGAALRTGFAHATGDVVVVQDADLEYDPRDILRLLPPLLSGEADVVYGSRFLSAVGQPSPAAKKSECMAGEDACPTVMTVGQPSPAAKNEELYGRRGRLPHVIHRLGNWLLTTASNAFTGLAITDMETCYKAFRREAIAGLPIRQNRFGFEPEVTARLARRKFRIREVPISYTARGFADGKKIGLKDLFNALWCIVRYGVAE